MDGWMCVYMFVKQRTPSTPTTHSTHPHRTQNQIQTQPPRNHYLKHSKTGAYYLEVSGPESGKALLSAALADDQRFAFTQAFQALGSFGM